MNELEQAVKRVKTGDIPAFEVIVRTFERRLRLFVHVILYDKDRVDDVVQETFITAYKQIDFYDPALPLYPWLKGIARNHIMNANSKLKRRRRLHEGYLHEALEGQSRPGLPDVETYVDGMIERLEHCIAKLSKGPRELLKTFYLNGRKIREIAGLFSMTEGNVRIRLMRVRAAMKLCLENDDA